MSELTLTVMRLGFLAVLWLFVIVAVQVIRSDLFGTRVTQRGSRRTAAEARPQQGRQQQQAAPPQQRQQPGRQRRGAPTKLVVSEGTLTGTTVALQGQTITLGRAHDSTIVLDDDYASSRHARIYPDRNALDDPGSRVHQRHVSGTDPAHHPDACSAGRADPYRQDRHRAAEVVRQ